MNFDSKQQAFFALVEAGLWEKDVRLSTFHKIDFQEVNRLAEEQAVIGLVAAGMEHVTDVKVPKEDILQFVGQALQLEQRNKAMNHFLAGIIDKLRKEGVYTVLLKGQGIAQCYERPLWRTCGDVDLFLSNDNYKNAVNVLTQLANEVEDENIYTKHIGFKIDKWEVELHGSLRSELWKRLDNMVDGVQEDIFYGGAVRSWQNDKTQTFLPRADEDVVYVFAHILQHLFKGGIGLRQICDWCRLLYTYRDSLNYGLLESRIRKGGIRTEWKVFATLAVDYLGMPGGYMPLYDGSNKWRKKADKLLAFVLETGNFGHNRDMSYRNEESAISRKWKTFYHITSDTFKQFAIFPMDSIRVWWRMMVIGLLSLVRK
jgi:hypothetical protein